MPRHPTIDLTEYLAHIDSGMSPYMACQQPGMPAYTLIHSRARKDAEFAERIALDRHPRLKSRSGGVRACLETAMRFIEAGHGLQELNDNPALISQSTFSEYLLKTPWLQKRYSAAAMGRRLHVEVKRARLLAQIYPLIERHFDCMMGRIEAGERARDVLGSGPCSDKTFLKFIREKPLYASRYYAAIKSRSHVDVDWYALAEAAVPKWLDPASRDDIKSEMVLDAIDGKLRVDDMQAKAGAYVKRYSRDVFRFSSLDAPVGDEGDATFVDLLTADASLVEAWS